MNKQGVDIMKLRFLTLKQTAAIGIAGLMLTLAACATIDVPLADRWLAGRKGMTTIDVTGIWRTSQWGFCELKQTGTIITGYTGKHVVKGVVDGRTLSLVLIGNVFKKTVFTVELKIENEKMQGRFFEGIMHQGDVPNPKNTVLFERKPVSYKDELLKANPALCYTALIDSRWNSGELGNEWLRFHEGKKSVNIGGDYYDQEWGPVRLHQVGNKVVGTYGQASVRGVVNDDKIYLLLLYHNYYVYYSAVLTCKDNELNGRYSTSLHYHDAYNDTYSQPMRAIKK